MKKNVATMTIKDKFDALYNAANKAWDGAFDGWEWDESNVESKRYVLGEKTNTNGFAFFTAGCRDIYGGLIWVEYDAKEDTLGIFVKDRPIQEKFMDDLKTLFEKYAPFNMQVKYERKSTPVLWRKEKVEPKYFLQFFKEFRKAYDEFYPLFYMFSVSAKGWYDGFYIEGSDC